MGITRLRCSASVAVHISVGLQLSSWVMYWPFRWAIATLRHVIMCPTVTCILSSSEKRLIMYLVVQYAAKNVRLCWGRLQPLPCLSVLSWAYLVYRTDQVQGCSCASCVWKAGIAPRGMTVIVRWCRTEHQTIWTFWVYLTSCLCRRLEAAYR